jgi:two-component system CheB/CheR fusion protein
MRRPPSSGSDLLALAVHEFRTPITIVGGYLRMLLRDPSSPWNDAQRRMIEEAEKSCGKLAGLVAELSDLSNLAAGTATLNQHDVPLFPLLEQTVDALGQDDERRTVVRKSDAQAVVKGDAVRLRQALTAVITGVRRELLPASELLIASKVWRTKAGRMAMIAMGVEPTVDRLLRARSTKLVPFNIWRGGCGLSIVVADQLIAVHGGRIVAAPDGPPTEPGAAIVLPLL